MLILLDPGHGHNTPGKRSPDGKFLEYAYNREIATRIVADLTENFFMDNLSDLEYLQSRVGKQAVVDTHVEGIVEWLDINT